MPSDPFSFFADLIPTPGHTGGPTARAQAARDHADPQDHAALTGAPPLPESPGAAQDALGAALDRQIAGLGSIQHTLAQILAVLAAGLPKTPETETLYLDNTNGQTINARGRAFVGIRSSITTPAVVFQRPSGTTASITLTADFQYFAAADGARVLAAATGSVGNYEFVYTDQIGGAVPQ